MSPAPVVIAVMAADFAPREASQCFVVVGAC